MGFRRNLFDFLNDWVFQSIDNNGVSEEFFGTLDCDYSVHKQNYNISWAILFENLDTITE